NITHSSPQLAVESVLLLRSKRFLVGIGRSLADETVFPGSSVRVRSRHDSRGARFRVLLAHGTARDWIYRRAIGERAIAGLNCGRLSLGLYVQKQLRFFWRKHLSRVYYGYYFNSFSFHTVDYSIKSFQQFYN